MSEWVIVVLSQMSFFHGENKYHSIDDAFDVWFILHEH